MGRKRATLAFGCEVAFLIVAATLALLKDGNHAFTIGTLCSSVINRVQAISSFFHRYCRQILDGGFVQLEMDHPVVNEIDGRDRYGDLFFAP